MGLTLRSRALVVTLAVAWLPYITTRCIDPVSCPTEHARQHDDHSDHGHHGHSGIASERGTHDETPAETPIRTCCDLTGKLNVLVSAGTPSITPVLFSSTLPTSAVWEFLHHQSPRRDLVPPAAHGPPAYLRNHILLI